MTSSRKSMGRLLVLGLFALCQSGSLLAEGQAARLVRAARAQIGVTVIYDGSYRVLAYPGGDVPIGRGACTDVIIRAYRAIGLDLQVAVHEDMKKAWAQYPRLWRLSGPDRNIDHRRVPNLATFFRRQGAALAIENDRAAYRPGDLVTWRLPSGAPHIGVVSDRRVGDRPLVIHNIGAGAAEEDVLFSLVQTGHYRYLPPNPPSSRADSRRHGPV